MRSGQEVMLVTLDVSYLELLHFERLLSADVPPAAKRRKRREPVQVRRVLQTWLQRADGTRWQLTATLGMSAPLDAPATLSVSASPALAVGDVIELQIVEEASAPPKL